MTSKHSSVDRPAISGLNGFLFGITSLAIDTALRAADRTEANGCRATANARRAVLTILAFSNVRSASRAR
ncbi:MAG: hypothetical protein M3P52_11520, partial [Actinomycetota bacterium]|nr:hypothetical protein [Actinomycetota bacterium]